MLRNQAIGLSFIRAGMTWRGVIASGPDQTECTFESVPCHPLVVQGARGALIELELTPENGQTVGLILSEGVIAPRDFPTRLTVEPGPMWIMGGLGAITLRAR